MYSTLSLKNTHTHTHTHAHTHAHTHTHTQINDQSGMDIMFSRGPRRPLLTQISTDPQLPEVDEWEMSPSEIIMEDSLGEGAFGEVYKAIVKGPLRSPNVRPSLRNGIAVPVAIKLLKGRYDVLIKNLQIVDTYVRIRAFIGLSFRGCPFCLTALIKPVVYNYF